MALPPESVNRCWRELVNDADKLDAIVDAMSNCMARVLRLRNNEVDNGRLALGKALYNEKESFPTRAQLDEMANIHRASDFVSRTLRIATALRNTAQSNTNVLLTPVRNAEPYCHSWIFKRDLGVDGHEETDSVLRVGGLRRSLYKDVSRDVFNWLMEIDGAMMVAFRDVVRDGGDEAPLVRLAQELATSIACRLTLLPDEEDDRLSTPSLQNRVAEEVVGSSVRAEKTQRSDLQALETLRVLALEGPKSDAGKRVLESKLHLLEYVVHRPPVELGLQGVNAAHMNLTLLARACSPHLDSQVRSNMVDQWYLQHGGFAATAAAQAIQKLELWSLRSTWDRPFIKVLYSPDEKPVAGAIDLPLMPFVHTPHRWRFVQSSPARTPFDWVQRRCVRMTSLVLQLLGHGALERGVVSSRIVAPVAMHATVEALVVMELLEEKRAAYSVGTKLLKFCEDVADMASHMSSEVSDAMLFISRFSTLELLSIFSPQSPALRLVMKEFTYRTRVALGNYQTAPIVPLKYVAFCYDSLAILMPVARKRRERLGLSLTHKGNPLVDMLRALPKVRGWTPLKGSLRLDLTELKQASPMLKNVLTQLAKSNSFVVFKRPYLGGQRYGSRKEFVFDSPQLVGLLNVSPTGEDQMTSE